MCATISHGAANTCRPSGAESGSEARCLKSIWGTTMAADQSGNNTRCLSDMRGRNAHLAALREAGTYPDGGEHSRSPLDPTKPWRRSNIVQVTFSPKLTSTYSDQRTQGRRRNARMQGLAGGSAPSGSGFGGSSTVSSPADVRSSGIFRPGSVRASPSPSPGNVAPRAPFDNIGDGDEVALLRTLFRELPSKPDGRVVSSVLGRYAGFLSSAGQGHEAIAQEFYLLALSTQDPDPRTAHTFHWFLCSHTRDYRSIPQYERIRARAPLRAPGLRPTELLEEVKRTHGWTAEEGGASGGGTFCHAAACLANFLDEVCGLTEEAGEVYAAAREGRGASLLGGFARGKYGVWLSRRGRAEDAREAEAELEAALAEDTKNAEALVDMAHLLSSRDAARGAALLRDALAAVPEDSRVLGEYAWFMERVVGDFDAADGLYQRAVTADPSAAGTLGRYAGFLAQVRGQAQAGADAYRRCHEADPLNLTGLLGHAGALEAAGDTAGAGALYARAVQEHPSDGDALGGAAAFALSSKGDRAEAVRLLEAAVAADPRHAGNLGALAALLSDAPGGEQGVGAGAGAGGAEAAQRLDRADALFRRAIEQDPGDARNLGRYAVFLERAGASAKAAQLYRQALDRAPRDSTVLCNYAGLIASGAVSGGGAPAAKELLLRALEADPEHAGALSMLADLCERVEGDLDAAQQLLRRALELQPTDPDALTALAAFTAAARNDLDAAHALYLRAVEQAPPVDAASAEALGALAVIEMQLARRPGADTAARIASAEARFAAAARLDPDNSELAANHGVFLAMVKGAVVPAVAELERALALDPGRQDILLSLAHVWELAGKDDARAEEAFARALAADKGPSHARLLGSYAAFRARTRGEDVDANLVLHEAAVEADPADGVNLAALALYLSAVMERHTEADALFRKAVVAAPHNGDVLGRYASFVGDQMHDSDAAEVYYKRAIEADARARVESAENLGKYAYFMHTVRGDLQTADELYRRAVACGAGPDTCANYATFLEMERDNQEQAEVAPAPAPPPRRVRARRRRAVPTRGGAAGGRCSTAARWTWTPHTRGTWRRWRACWRTRATTTRRRTCCSCARCARTPAT